MGKLADITRLWSGPFDTLTQRISAEYVPNNAVIGCLVTNNAEFGLDKLEGLKIKRLLYAGHDPCL